MLYYVWDHFQLTWMFSSLIYILKVLYFHKPTFKTFALHFSDKRFLNQLVRLEIGIDVKCTRNTLKPVTYNTSVD